MDGQEGLLRLRERSSLIKTSMAVRAALGIYSMLTLTELRSSAELREIVTHFDHLFGRS